MDEVVAQATKAILTSGPLALTLLVALWKLWNALQAERDRHAAEEKALQDKLVDTLTKLTAAMRGEHQ